MRNLKRVLSLALALVMVLGMMVITTSAATFADDDEITYTEAVDVISAIGVITGDNGSFYPNRALTREEGAALICYLLMGKDKADKLTGSGNFADVAADRWSAGEIDYCANLGIILGYTDANGDLVFNPKGELTAVAYGRMLLGALGYDGAIEGYTGANWASSIAADMIDNGLEVKGVDMDAVLTREQAAQMTLQALEATMVEYEDKGSNITIGGVEIVTGAKEAEPKAAIEVNGTERTYNGTEDEELQFVEKYFSDLTKETGDRDAYSRPAAYKWVLDGTEDVHNVIKAPAYTFTVKKAVTSTTDNADLSDAINDALDITKASKKLVYSDDDNTYENGVRCATYGAVNFDKGDVVEVYVNAADKTDITDVVITRESAAQIVNVTPNTGKATVTIRGEKVVYNYNIFVDTNMDGTSDLTLTDLTMADYTDEYVKGAYLTVTLKAGAIVDSAIAEVVTGAIETITDTKDVTIAGTKYDMANASIPGNSTTVDFKKGEYAVVLGTTGYALAVDTIVAGTVSTLSNVVYANGVKWTEQSNSYGVTEYKVYTQIVAMDGTVSDILVGGWKNDGSVVASSNYGIVNASGVASSITAGVYMLEDVDANVPAGKPAYKNLNGTCTITAAPGTSYAFGTITNTGLTLKADDKKLDSKYITDSTVYVQVKGDSARIETSVVTGGLNYVTTSGSESLYTVTKTSGGNTEIVAVVIADSTLTATATDLLYIKSATTTENANGYVQTVYDMAGNKSTITVKSGDQGVTGFVTYAIDSKGVYDVTDATTTLSTDVEWNKTIAKLEGVEYAKSFYADAINVKESDGSVLSDIPADKLVVVDLRVTDGDKNGYDAAITSVAEMQAAMATFMSDNTTYYAVHGDVYVGLNGAVVFFVTGTGAPFDVASVATSAAFAEAIEEATTGEVTIKLMADVSIDNTDGMEYVLGAGADKIVINGNGHTITVNTADQKYPLFKSAATVVINDAVLDSDSTLTGFLDRGIYFACDVELNNVEMKRLAVFSADATLNNVSITDVIDTYGLFIVSNENTIVLNNVDIEAPRGIKVSSQAPWPCNPAFGDVELEINGGSVTSTKKAAVLVGTSYDATIAIDGLDISGAVADTTNAVWIDSDWDGDPNVSGTITVTGATQIPEP